MSISDFSDVFVVSNSRAEYGPLESVIAALPGCGVFGFDVSRRDPHEALEFAVTAFHKLMNRVYKPKLVVVLGDRYETLAAALAAMFLNIPVAHIHGGEMTAGAFDDAMRDSITAIAELHFAATPEAQERILMMRGRSVRPYRVYTTGAPGLDGIGRNTATRLIKRFLVTFHPETRANDKGAWTLATMLAAFQAFPDYEIAFMGVNTDPGSSMVVDQIQAWMRATGRGQIYDIPHDRYVEFMKGSALVIGNSSAGIIEAPWVGIPTVNLGKRQDGRPQAPSIFNATGNSKDEVIDKIANALSWPGPNYWVKYHGGAGPKIARVIAEFCGIEKEQHHEQNHPG